MTETETGAVSDQGETGIANAYDASNSVVDRYIAPLKAGLVFAATIGLGFLMRMMSENQLGDSLGAIIVWFSLFFAGAGVIAWLGYRVVGAVRNSGEDV